MENYQSILKLWLDETPISLILLMVTATAFLVYGLQIFVSKYMEAEFIRFGMTRIQKNFAGIMQIFGSLSLFLGPMFPILGIFASCGFVIMMIIAMLIRWKIKDHPIRALPAIVLFGMNIWLAYIFYYWSII